MYWLFNSDEIKTELGKKLKEHLDDLLDKIRDAIEKGKGVKEETLEKVRIIPWFKASENRNKLGILSTIVPHYTANRGKKIPPSSSKKWMVWSKIYNAKSGHNIKKISNLFYSKLFYIPFTIFVIKLMINTFNLSVYCNKELNLL